VGEVLSSAAFQNAFWIFIGILCGSFIQFIFHWLIIYGQGKNAKKIFLSEIEINKIELKNVTTQIERMRQKISAGQINEHDFSFDFSGFNYRMVDPLINTGHFHQILGANGVKKYFKMMNDLNIQMAKNYTQMLKEHHENGQSLEMLRWLEETKLPDWRGAIDFAEERTR